MIITCVGMNVVAAVGLFAPSNINEATKTAAQATPPIPTPTVSITIDPASITVNTTSAINWTTTGSPTKCVASGDWEGEKTQFGAESTGRIKTVGDHTYTLTCTNVSGSAEAKAVISVSAGAVVAKSATITGKSSSSTASNFCNGNIPCYGPRDVATHNSVGNCWGYNGNRVINISGFDAAYHQVKSGVGSIEISDVCGKNLAPALNNSVKAGGQSRDHNPTTKNNSDKNLFPYFVGYFDAGK